jgi:hypothetical protein
MSGITISELANVATAVGGVATAVAVFLLAYQISLQRKQQKNAELTQLFERAITPDFRQKLSFVYSLNPEDLVLSKLDKGQQLIVTEVTGAFEEMGFKVRKGIVPRRESIEGFYDWIIPCAQRLRLHIQDEQTRRGPSYRYREHFDWLAKECKLFQLKRDGCKSASREKSLDELLKLNPMPSLPDVAVSNRG